MTFVPSSTPHLRVDAGRLGVLRRVGGGRGVGAQREHGGDGRHGALGLRRVRHQPRPRAQARQRRHRRLRPRPRRPAAPGPEAAVLAEGDVVRHAGLGNLVTCEHERSCWRGNYRRPAGRGAASVRGRTPSAWARGRAAARGTPPACSGTG